MAITSLFTLSAGTLSVFGDALGNNIALSRDAAGKLLVNGGAVAVLGGTPTVANTALIQVFGQGADDVITLNEANGALPRANIFAGAGNDTATGGSGNDQIFGQAGNDVLLGKGGNDFLFGGADNDALTGGDGDDQMFGEAGDDRMIWNPGDDSDLMEGGDGTDTAEVNGGNGAEVFTATANGTRVRFDRIDPAPFALDIGTTEKLVVNMNGGNDTFSATGNLAALISVTVDGGAGDDTILGSNGNDTLLGGDGNDFIDGNQGADTAFLGAGNDVFQWDPGDGNDTVEGQAGTDTLLFNGANIAEIMALSANGSRALFTRNVANITMDLNGVEVVDVTARGGADSITIGNMAGTGVTRVNLDLAGTPGTGVGDGAADAVIANGRSTTENVSVTGSTSSYAVTGLAAELQVTGSEGLNDSLTVNLLGGNDIFSAAGLAAGIVQLTVDGGIGNDTITGSQGADLLIGGDDNDVVTGGRGDDVALLGANDDSFIWNPGDGSDTVEGQAGADMLQFNGANISETINIAANGSRALFTRDVANITMDLNGMEKIAFKALGGADAITVGDLSGTDVKQVALDLAGAGGSGDGAADTVIANGTAGGDNITATASGTTLSVAGLAAGIAMTAFEGGIDHLTLNGLGGDDVINASSLGASFGGVTMNGGLGNDLFVGSAGDDVMFGGDGSDTALMGGGDDTFVWNPGDDNDIVEGQSGFDTLQFNGANVSERIDISANGGRTLFTRDVASVLMDLNDVEKIAFNALGGADNITVNDLSGTDVTQVSINLAGTIGGSTGDGAADTVSVNGTAGDDVIVISGGAGGITVAGLSAEIQVFNFDALDKLVINGLGGSDVIDASGLDAGIQLLVNAGDGDDVVIGGAGNDVLNGDAGDDVLIGGLGLDVLNGGTGSNILLQ